MQRLFVGMLLLLLPVLAFGQAQTTGRISGHVVDYQNQPVVGATIQITSLALSGPRAMTTDINGNFLASLLPPGDYTVTVTMVELNPAKATLRIGIGQTIPLEIKLQKGAEITEEVTVTGNTSKMETTAVGENFSYEKKVDELPVVNRRIENVAQLAPNVQIGPTGNLSISGAMTSDSAVLLDGAEISDPYFGNESALYMEDAIEEVQVLTNGVSARYGRFQGGVINATTRTGTNDFSTGLRVDLSKQSWNAKTPWAEEASNKLNKIFQGTIAGPILRDRIWYFVGGRKIPTRKTEDHTFNSNQNYVQYFTTTMDETRFQTKIRGAFSPNHTIEGSYLSYKRSDSNLSYGNAGDLLALGESDIDNSSRTFVYQGVLSDKSFIDVQMTQKRSSSALGGTDKGRSVFEDWGLARIRNFNNHPWDFNDPSIRDNDTLGVSFTQVIPTAKFGEHTIEGGIQGVKSTIAGENRQSPSGYNLRNIDAWYIKDAHFTNEDPFNTRYNMTSFFDGGISVRFKAMPWNGEQSTKSKAVFVTDSWEIGRWRFDGGLRWEKYDVTSPSPSLKIDTSSLSPRLGVTYNFAPDWQVQAFYGEYVSRLNDGVLTNNSGVSAAPRVVNLYTGLTRSNLTASELEALLRDDSGWGITVAVTDPKQPTSFISKNLEAPYSTDISLSVRHSFPKNIGSVTATLTRREFKKLLDDYVGGQGISIIKDPFNPEVTMDPLDTTIWKNCDQCERKYEAVTVTWDYRPTPRWDFGGNYTLSWLRGNYEGEAQDQPANGSWIGNYPLAWDMKYGAPYGYLASDTRHSVRVWGNYRFDFKRFGTLTLGGILTYKTGTPWSKAGSVSFEGNMADYVNLSGQSYVYYTDGRGNHRFPNVYQFDLTTRYQFNLPGVKKVGGFVKFDIVNFFNHKRLIAPVVGGTVEDAGDGNYVWYPSADFGKGTGTDNYQAARQFNVTVGFTY